MGGSAHYYLLGAVGEAMNAILAVAGHNLWQIRNGLRLVVLSLLAALTSSPEQKRCFASDLIPKLPA